MSSHNLKARANVATKSGFVLARKLAVLSALAVLASAVVPPAAAHAQEAKSSIFYLVEAHPDDEVPGWQLIDDFQDHYTVFVMLTHGERSVACLSAEESHSYPYQTKGEGGEPTVGPYRYEGPDSPVGEPDQGERHPIGDPWQGLDTRECGRAKVASWHWFLDDVAALDPGLPDFGISKSATGDPWVDDDYQGSFCVRKKPGKSRSKNPHPHDELGCADVWANDFGARVLFDLGDGGWPAWDSDYLEPNPFDEEDVVAAVDRVRSNRVEWGLPGLPEAGLMAAAPGCDPIEAGDRAHRDHEAVQNALYEHDFEIGPQFGVVCDGTTNSAGGTIAGALSGQVNRGSPDRRYVESPSPTQGPDAVEWRELNVDDPVTNSRISPVGINYGWIVDGERGHWDFPFYLLWQRFD
jgi:hypothetical protein